MGLFPFSNISCLVSNQTNQVKNCLRNIWKSDKSNCWGKNLRTFIKLWCAFFFSTAKYFHFTIFCCGKSNWSGVKKSGKLDQSAEYSLDKNFHPPPISYYSLFSEILIWHDISYDMNIDIDQTRNLIKYSLDQNFPHQLSRILLFFSTFSI